MITRRELHTYRDEFPLILISPDGHQGRLSHDLDWIFRSQILNLSDFSRALPLTYIARHTDDKIPDAILEEFRSRSPSFGSVPEGWTLGVPTVWFVCYSDDESKTT